MALAMCGTSLAQPVESPRLALLEQALTAATPDALAVFWREVESRHTPLIEPVRDAGDQMLVTFIYRSLSSGEIVNVGVYGALADTGDPVPSYDRFANLPNSNVWYRTYQLSARARFGYQLGFPRGRLSDPRATAVALTDDGLTLELGTDPLNPRRFGSTWNEAIDGLSWTEDRGLVWNEDKVAQLSYAQGPLATATPFVDIRSGIRRGRVFSTTIESRRLGNRRDISVYTPPGRDDGCPDCNFLLIFDRAQYLTAVPTPTLLDNMLADGVIEPTVAVFVGNASQSARSFELPPNQQFQEFLREELLPWARSNYRFSADPRRAVVVGSSFGGLAAAYTAYSHPSLFGNVLSQSGSYWWWPGWTPARIVTRAGLDRWLNEESGWVGRQFAEGRNSGLRLYLDVGRWEGRLMMLPNRTFRDVLQARGHRVVYREFEGGHDYAAWRATLSDGLQVLLSKRE